MRNKWKMIAKKIVLLLILLLNQLIYSQQTEYKKYLTNAISSAREKKLDQFINWINLYSTALEEEKISILNLPKDDAILYSECFYIASVISELEIPNDMYNQVFTFTKYIAEEYSDGKSMFYLGYLYDKGLGGASKDVDKSIYWYKEAIKKDIPQAYRNLAYNYQKGIGVEQNFQTAFNYYKIAYDKGQTQLIPELGFCKYKLERYEEALPLLTKAVEEGKSNNWIATYLGNMYYNGNYVTRDYEKAKYYYEIAANAKDSWGYANLGGYYQYVVKDYTKAVENYKKAIEIKQNDRANYELGRIYHLKFDNEIFDDDFIAYNYLKNVSDNYNFPHNIFYRGLTAYFSAYETNNNLLTRCAL